MVRIYDIPKGFDATAELRVLLPYLPYWRLQKALSYRHDIDRFLCTKSFLMLEEMLRKNYGLVKCPFFSYGCHGKPFFRECPKIFFNISHCRRGIACVVIDKPVGIDIEEIQFDEDLAKVILDKDELTFVTNAEEPSIEFTKIWTRKESFQKLTGEGIRDSMKDVLHGTKDVTFTTRINRSAGYIYSIATWKREQPDSVTNI